MDRHLAGNTCDVIVLDLGLPGEDGLSIAQRLSSQADIGLLILTARDRLEDRIAGWESGAHVYLVKPVPLEEIAAVVSAVYRKRHPDAATSAQGWILSGERRELLSPDGSSIPLTHRERLLLMAFADSPKRVISRDLRLEQEVGGAIDSLVHRLRRKLKHYGDPIRTVYGEGFVFDADLVLDTSSSD
jgi:DNA-binding response OmpR family regulator